MSDHEHTTATLLPLYRSDLCGEPCAGRWYSHCLPHGWWCPLCGADTLDPEAPQVGSFPRWAVHVLPDFRVRVTSPDALGGAELLKFEASIKAASREAEERRGKALAAGLGHVGWRITAERVLWLWSAAHRREGCSLVGIRPRIDCTCTVCRETIEAGSQAFRGDGGVTGLRRMDEWAAVRVCSMCSDSLPREAFLDSAPVTSKLPALRLISR